MLARDTRPIGLLIVSFLSWLTFSCESVPPPEDPPKFERGETFQLLMHKPVCDGLFDFENYKDPSKPSLGIPQRFYVTDPVDILPKQDAMGAMLPPALLGIGTHRWAVSLAVPADAPLNTQPFPLEEVIDPDTGKVSYSHRGWYSLLEAKNWPSRDPRDRAFRIAHAAPGMVEIVEGDRSWYPGLVPKDNVEAHLINAALSFSEFVPIRAVRFFFSNNGDSVFFGVDGNEMLRSTLDDFVGTLGSSTLGVETQLQVETLGSGVTPPRRLAVLIGRFNSFVVGGEDLAIDDICLISEDCTTGLSDTAHLADVIFPQTPVVNAAPLSTIGLEVEVLGGTMRRLDEVHLEYVTSTGSGDTTLTASVTKKSGTEVFNGKYVVPGSTATSTKAVVQNTLPNPAILVPGEEYLVSFSSDQPGGVQYQGDKHRVVPWIEARLRYLVNGPIGLSAQGSPTWKAEPVPNISLVTRCEVP